MQELITVALVITLVIAVYSIGLFMGVDTYQPLIDLCELELPRNQSCVLVAVPEVK